MIMISMLEEEEEEEVGILSLLLKMRKPPCNLIHLYNSL